MCATFVQYLQDWNGDGEPDYALCLTLGRGSVYSVVLFLHILGSMTQTRYLGVLVDPLNMQPLVRLCIGRS